MSTRRERATAYHEAGHAVIRSYVGLGVKRVSIVKDDESLGRTSHYPVSNRFRPDLDQGPRMRSRIEREVMSAFAGVLAEKKATGRRNHIGAGHDYEFIGNLVGYVTGSDYEAEAYVEWLCRHTEGLLDLPLAWTAVEGVVAALLEERALSAKRFRQVMHEARFPVTKEET